MPAEGDRLMLPAAVLKGVEDFLQQGQCVKPCIAVVALAVLEVCSGWLLPVKGDGLISMGLP